MKESCKMSRQIARSLGLALLAAGLLVLGSFFPVRAAESPFKGTWRVMLQYPDQDVALALVEITHRLESIEVLFPGPLFGDVKAEKISTVGKALHFQLEGINSSPLSGQQILCVFYPPDSKDKEILGTVELHGQRYLAKMEPSETKELEARVAVVASPDKEEYQKAMREEDTKAKEKALQDLLKEAKGTALNYDVDLELLNLQATDGKDAKEIGALADKIIKLASAYGPEMHAEALNKVARRILQSGKLTSLAVEKARMAEKMLSKSDSAMFQVAVLKTLATALKKANDTKDQKELAERIEKLEVALDEDFLKNSLPIKPQPYEGRKSHSQRLVVVELFTGSECGPCVATDLAYDAAIQSFKPEDVTFMQYHLHVPGPDALANPDSVERAAFYSVGGTPSLYINGNEWPPNAGTRDKTKRDYDPLRKRIGQNLEDEPEASLKISAKKIKDGQYEVQAQVADLEQASKSMRLHFALVEDVVRYPGGNGQRLHHFVVREFPGGPQGFVLDESTAKFGVKINIPELRKKLNVYLQNCNERKRFPIDDRPLDLKNLKVVAFIQDNDFKEIKQAAQIRLDDVK